MALSTGTHLGPYEILAPLGAGGMGEVYRARDTRLGRQVAVKVLPPEVAGDADRLRRFEQEAQSVAALNHPNILTLYDVGTADGVSFLVTELLEGRSLRQLLSEERLSAGKAIAIAAAMADGLAAAHARGVVHRDLKPENVFVTADGQIKLLDFGLAKAAPVNDASGAETQAATATAMILGTPGYMAPEQARAQTVDSRSDVFAFGAVLYEMLTGHQAFGGATPLDRISAVLRDPPPPIPSTAERPVPVALLRIVERCLEKAPSARFQSTPDLAFALKTVSTIEPAGPAHVATPAPALTASSARSSRSTLMWSLTVAGILIVSGYVAWLQNQPAPAPAPASPNASAGQASVPSATPPVAAKPAPVTQPPVSLPVPSASASASAPPATGAPARQSVPNAPAIERRTISLADAPLFAGPGMMGGSPLAISHDGSRLAYVGIEPAPVGRGGGPALYVRGINDSKSTRLPGTEGAAAPSFSADGQTISFATNRVLKRIPVTGGPVQTVPAGGTPEDPGQRGASPQTLPNGATLFTAMGAGQPPRAAVRLGDGSVRDLITNATNARFVPPGFLVYAQGPRLLGAPFDAARLVVTGEPVTLVENVQASPAGGSAFSVSSSGTLAYLPAMNAGGAGGAAAPGRSFAWIDSTDGRETPLTVSPRWYVGVQLAPDSATFLALLPDDQLGRGRGGRLDPGGRGQGGRLARANAQGTPDAGRRLVSVNLTTGAMTPLTDATVTSFAWMSDARRVLYAKTDGSLFWRRVDAITPEEQVRPAGSVFAGLDQMDVAANGRTVMWSGRGGEGGVGLWTLTGLDPNAPAGGASIRIERLPVPQNVGGVMSFPRISPDGRWLAHVIARPGRSELIVKPMGQPGAMPVATDVSPTAPTWRGNHVIWQRNGASGVELIAAEVLPTAPPRIGTSRVIYVAPAAGGVTIEGLSPDGKRVAVARQGGGGNPVRQEIHVVFNITALRKP